MISGLQINVSGIVQGVGFRPFIFSLANQLQLFGWIRNTSSGVEIELEGEHQALQQFICDLQLNPPPLARIDSLETQPIPLHGYAQFEIIASHPSENDFIPISPDIAICPDCRKELFDPSDRRFRYPFNNCINCGPRFSIIQDIPYDRPKTTMVSFSLCPECLSEYQNPLDRRFHAQPIACSTCGPSLSYIEQGKQIAEGEFALARARASIVNGGILAIKGLGGFHLACDALNPEAVLKLRERKHRIEKPFALMAVDISTIEYFCVVSKEERDLLQSPSSPIVLLKPYTSSDFVQSIAPNSNLLGFMLPYTPLHLLLLEKAEGFPLILVMTSGNVCEEPIAFMDQDACERLSSLADGFLTHNRPIHIRVDDSVMRIINHQTYPIRRSRGYSPDPLLLPTSMPSVLATGAEIKNTFCLTRERYAFLSHHIGDMENQETFQSFDDGIQYFEKLFRIQPEALACDLHPDYLSSLYARNRAIKEKIPIIEIQHHHAHLAACLADSGWTSEEPVLGFCLDGTGYGSDSAIWGGEVLLGGYSGYQRVHHLRYTPQPGGDLATRQVSRMALSYLFTEGIPWDPDLPSVITHTHPELTLLQKQLEANLNSPSTSSMGRLFDAIASLIGITQKATFEGQAAIQLEAVADPEEEAAYPMIIQDDLILPGELLKGVIKDFRDGILSTIISARFHNSIVQMIREVATINKNTYGCKTIALSGGVWQNEFLLEKSCKVLSKDGFNVLLHHRVPTNDGGISLGQAVIAQHWYNNQP